MGLESSQDNLLAGPGRAAGGRHGRGQLGGHPRQHPVRAARDPRLGPAADARLGPAVHGAAPARRVRRGEGRQGRSAVVLDAKTGEVLAMANARTFDPRAFSSADESTLGNPAVSSPYEPGSVNKVVTMAAALEYGLVTPDQRASPSPGSIRVADRTVSDAWNHGTEHYTLTGILAKSSNVGTLMTAQEVGEDRFADMLAPLRPGQADGRRAARREPRPGAGPRDLVGLDVRQPADRAGPVDDRCCRWPGCTRRSPTTGCASRRGSSPGHDRAGRRAHPDPAPRAGAGRCRPETARTLRTMLTAVTQDGHTPTTGAPAPAAAIPGYQVAGKTGTAQQVDPTCGCYASSTYWITFAGMLPAAGPAVRRRDHAGRPAGRDERRAAVPRHRVVPGAAREAAGEPGPAAGPDPGVARPARRRGGSGGSARRRASAPVDGVAPAAGPPRPRRRPAGDPRRTPPPYRTATDTRGRARELRVRARRVFAFVLGVPHRAAAWPRGGGGVGRRSGAIMGAGSLPTCRPPAPPPLPRPPGRRGPGPRDASTCTSSPAAVGATLTASTQVVRTSRSSPA